METQIAAHTLQYVESAMKIGLFIPCYIDQFYPHVAVATLRLLERLGCDVEYPLGQTCCGQPMANAGFEEESIGAMRLFTQTFEAYDCIVTPSGSCGLHVREHYGKLAQNGAVRHVRQRTYELCEFLADVLEVETLEASFPHKVGLHASCYGLRGLRLGCASELHAPGFDKVRRLLHLVDGIELVDLDRRDECCGFGGTFAVTEEAVSVKMGRDRLRDHLAHGAEVITSTDMSCLMHLGGLIHREGLPVHDSVLALPVIDHPASAARFNKNEPRTDWHNESLWFVRQKRDQASHGVPEWEALRERASQIKEHTLSRLDDYLTEFEEKAQANDVHVHWAKDATEHNRIVYDILRKHQAKRIVKSKSMLTEECHLNPFLEEHGIEVVDTDLGERIVQFAGEPPSHIVMRLSISRKKRSASAARGACGQRAQHSPRPRRLPQHAQVYPLRGLYEHLPDLPA